MSTYFDFEGTEVTKEQISAAFDSGDATLIHGNGDGKTLTMLSLKHKDYDTRNTCHSVWDERWTRKPSSLRECLDAARGL